MSTDFNYGNKTVNTAGPVKPSGKDMPLDARTRINTYSEKETIPNPFVGMIVTVLTDEKNNNKMTDYKVKSLKANSAGIANMVIDEMIPYVDYLGVSSSGGGTSAGTGEGLTTEQAQQLQTAYEHSQSVHVQASDIPSKTSDLTNDSNYATETFVTSKIAEAQLGGDEVDLSAYATKAYADNAVSTALDGHTFKFLTQSEYDSLETKDPLVEYHITDAASPETIDTTSFATDLSLTGSNLQLKNSSGNLIGNAVTLPSTGGESLNLSDYYTKIEVDEKLEKIVVSSGGGSSEILPKVVLFGDSITDPNANGEWFKVIRNYATFKSLKNYARGYCTWANKSDTQYNITDTSDADVSSNVIWNQYNRMVKDIENHVIEVPDCVVILCGGNDAIMNKEIGDPDTVFDGNVQSTEANAHTTTSSAIRFVCELLMTNYPTTQIILTTPIQMGTKAYNDKILLTREAIIKCCNKMGVKVIDQTYESGVYQYRESVRKYNLKADNIHLTPEGGDTVARYLAREFKNKINDRYISGNSSSTVVNVESISLDKTSTSMISGNTITLTATITPSNATNKNVTWSSNSENAILTPNGLSCNITSSTIGVYTITATAQDGGASSSCTINVIQEGASEADASLIKYIDFRDGDNETKPTKITDRVDKYEYTILGATNLNQWIANSTHDVGWKDSGLRFYSEQYAKTGITKFNYIVPSEHTFEFACSIDDFSAYVNLLSIRQTWTDMKYQALIVDNSTIRLQNGGGLSADGSYSFKPDVIYHFAIVKSESKIALYINGQNVIPETDYKSAETSESMPLQPFGVDGNCLSGLYCYFKLYNAALSTETIQSNYEIESALRTMDR